jgi:hypothetical protein
MSASGLAPCGHLCDGRLHLVLVRDVSRLHYLRFLASIPKSGLISSIQLLLFFYGFASGRLCILSRLLLVLVWVVLSLHTWHAFIPKSGLSNSVHFLTMVVQW